MEQADNTDEDALRAHIEILREEMGAGRVNFSSEVRLVIDSMKAVRYGPDGKVDLSTVDGRVCMLANTHLNNGISTCGTIFSAEF
jgi:hypothetical protein